MTDQTPTVIRSEVGITGYHVTMVVTVTTGDSFKVRDLGQVVGVVGLKIADWTSLGFTFTENTITVTTLGLVRTPIVVLAGGIK